MPHILLTVHGTVPTMWALIGKAGIGLAGSLANPLLLLPLLGLLGWIALEI